jgi:aminopeptidase N
VKRAAAAAIFCLLALACLRAGAALPHLDLNVRLDPASRQLSAVAVIKQAPPRFSFTLHESLSVMGAASDNVPVPVRRVAVHGALNEWRVEASAPGVLRIEYGGRLPALEALDHRSVMRALPPMASQRGSYLSASGAWYPSPAPLFTYRVQLAIEGGQKGVVAGRLLAEESRAGPAPLYRASFEFAAPADGIDLMAGPYTVHEKLAVLPHGASVRLRAYFFTELHDLAEPYLEDSLRYLRLYSERVGAYPFTEFSIVASPLPTGLGMPGLTYIGASVIRLPFIRATSLGHEVLHNWWGNGVLVDYARGNWAEGLTTFMADYAFKERESAEAARDMRLAWLRDFAAIPEGRDMPLVAFRSRTHGAAAAVGYGKAAMLFVMLRELLGEATFERGVRLFWKTNRFQVASWSELRMAFERASGRELSGFFEQWLNRAGGPALRITDARLAPGKEQGSSAVRLTIEQGEPPYQLLVPVQLVADERSAIREVQVEAARQTVSLQVDAAPSGVRLDPELKLWRRLDPEELPPILRQWIIARAPRLMLAARDDAVRGAARTLAKRLFESAYREIEATRLTEGDEPVLIVGLHGEVDALLGRLRLPPRGAPVRRGSAQAWTIERAASATPVAVVSATDAQALEALLRPLPHYGAQSYVVFEGSKAIERGVWPVETRLVPVAR